MESGERQKKRIRVPRQKDSNGNPIPHKHVHKSKLYKHKNGDLAYGSEIPESTNAVSYYPNTTGDVTSISLTTHNSTNDSKSSKHSHKSKQSSSSKNSSYTVKSGKRVIHYDPESPEFNGKPLHILDNLSDLYYDSADGDDFAQLEKDKKFSPQKSLKPDMRFRGRHYMDTTTMSESTIDTVPSTAPTTSENEIKSRSISSFSTSDSNNFMNSSHSTQTSEGGESKGKSRSSKHRDSANSSMSSNSKSLNQYQLGQMKPTEVQYSLFDEYASGKAITRIDDIILTQEGDSTIDSDYIPARPHEDNQLDDAEEASGVYIEASDTGYDYIGVDPDTETIPTNAIPVEPTDKVYYGTNMETDGLVTVEEFVSATSGSAEFVEDMTASDGQVLVEVTDTSNLNNDNTIDVLNKKDFDKKYEYAKSVRSAVVNRKDNSSIYSSKVGAQSVKVKPTDNKKLESKPEEKESETSYESISTLEKTHDSEESPAPVEIPQNNQNEQKSSVKSQNDIESIVEEEEEEEEEDDYEEKDEEDEEEEGYEEDSADDM
ncbi:hypothetical protein TVAG_163730 [Trichomonas vaginalis G3]|uniref:Uncharacterized protein n=1 Tax=Trichomonas vaginalis (strain ATCC PRA-98 / G3) TaxID=412133 RepID=A2DG50_TRIV3|nr:hypothetical protein TVAGG3_0953800 [Trichomonas vaginalis G3]EAY20677.1 hypothetical protein TVAG_163730 [Trichomonas vaginalis G3]KAI5487398.1 hypothetical protein TVAGG3_0953800 [Trichomonas vaginalis G3]|eukprot:XP_001581663.1 hypothetical protein [Trichomonas vaginalis G3]